MNFILPQGVEMWHDACRDCYEIVFRHGGEVERETLDCMDLRCSGAHLMRRVGEIIGRLQSVVRARARVARIHAVRRGTCWWGKCA
jgi:hypothetical protein